MTDTAIDTATDRTPLLAVEGLKTYLYLRRGVVKAIDGVDLHVHAGESLGIIGESGSGKTMTSLSIMRLLPQPGGRIVAGSIRLNGVDLLQLSERDMAANYRGRQISMISQDPLASLNPVFTIGDQVGAPFRYHGLAKDEADIRRSAIDVLRRLRIPSPERRLDDYPHQFSGGMRQRVVAAMAIACSPRLLIADEPTSALDVTIQAQMLDLLREIQHSAGLGLILITHDLGVAASVCHRIAVMYSGRIVETGDVREIYARPAHPYTQALLQSLPRLGEKKRRLYSIAGQPPSLLDRPRGCAFAARCAHRMPICDESPPPTVQAAPGQSAACWLLKS
ncbi:MAG TPA: ABC transporter ATP-binding protein [Povalibacter sp.]|mgnify:CR=1 FL=1|uniref:ABC transporter ATP-binding protein n=1 Tax=Povalibacter sp. TaxID=1962978 RepID=UPI002C5AE3C5|nr:ABC transporter ATP-binding protein [Povalibacter sp.]HMN47373.1 ABC transporter ATP-binding protein [Povalibacter sp.]